MQYVPVLSTLVSFAFAGSIFYRYAHRKGMHLLLWGIGMVLYGIGTLCEVLLILSFSPLVLKIWYIAGAMLTAAWLGQGTVHLLVRRGNIAMILTVILSVVSLLAIWLVLTAGINVTAANGYQITQSASAQYGDILIRGGFIVFLTIILNIYGTITLVGGALYSVYIFWRKHILVDRMIGNILIAVGALFPVMAGSLLKAGVVDLLYLSELIGAILMYLGFLKATSSRPVVKSDNTTAAPAGE
jgi:hypothetical protein